MQARIAAARRDAEMSGGQMQARIAAARRDAEMSGEQMQARIAAARCKEGLLWRRQYFRIESL